MWNLTGMLTIQRIHVPVYCWHYADMENLWKIPIFIHMFIHVFVGQFVVCFKHYLLIIVKFCLTQLSFMWNLTPMLKIQRIHVYCWHYACIRILWKIPICIHVGIFLGLFQVSIYLNWIVRNAAELELAMNSVERVDEFIHLERELDSHHKGWNFLRIKIKWKEYRKSRNFNDDLILALLARLFSSLKLCIAYDTYHLKLM